MDDQYHTLSFRLYEILDYIGASEEMRDKYREYSIVKEIVVSMPFLYVPEDEKYTYYIFGSSCEGTTTTGLNADVDGLICCEIPVVERISDAPEHRQSFLMIADETTKPGYFKLQLVINKVPIADVDSDTLTDNGLKYELDQYGRICLRHVHADDPNRNGPAVSSTGVDGVLVYGLHDRDTVFAFRLQHIPRFAKSWITRVTSSNRLNETQIEMLKESGCFFVGKNHPSSQNGLIEWRLSFSLQERELISSINSTQHKCYILLKIIKKDIIQIRVPESISSYHFKTCLLYAIEKTPCGYWTRRNLLDCVLLCIKILLHWVKAQYCPNYFIPEENMFDRLERTTLRRVQAVLEDMIENWCRFIWMLTCDDISNLMSNVLFGHELSIMKAKHNYVSETEICSYIQLNNLMFEEILKNLERNKCISATRSILFLHVIEAPLLQIDSVRDHTDEEIRQAIRYFIPYLHLQRAQSLASIMLSTIDTSLLRVLFGWFKYYIEESKNCNTISANLIVASYCLQSDRNDICEMILLKCESSLKSHVVSVCRCGQFRPMLRTDAIKELLGMFSTQTIPYTEFVRTCTTGCLAFLPSQTNIVPPALRYEMYRSFNTLPGMDEDQIDVVVVDSTVYLYFLQYVLYSKTNKPVYKQRAVDKLFQAINTVSNIRHQETSYNLMGWVFKEENKIQLAMECFLTSWRIRPIHNAAKWHVLEMFRSINRI